MSSMPRCNCNMWFKDQIQASFVWLDTNYDADKVPQPARLCTAIGPEQVCWGSEIKPLTPRTDNCTSIPAALLPLGHCDQ